MADTFTPRLTLIKPDVLKDALIGDINGNMDKIDAEFVAVDGRLDKLELGTTASTTSGLTAATGFSVGSFTGRKMGDLCQVGGVLTRTGADLGPTTGTGIHAGNLAGDPLMCTLPAGYRPDTTIPVMLTTSFGTWGARITTDGKITIYDGPPDASISTSDNITFGTMFFIP